MRTPNLDDTKAAGKDALRRMWGRLAVAGGALVVAIGLGGLGLTGDPGIFGDAGVSGCAAESAAEQPVKVACAGCADHRDGCGCSGCSGCAAR